jgi:peptidoglycan LD-endopeptidase LytH
VAAPSSAQRGHARTARRFVVWALVLVSVVWTLVWSWQQPFMTKPRALWELSRMPPPTALPVPVQGVRASRIADTFGAPRGRDRAHAGVDIFAPRGTPVLSATRGMVVSVREGGLGGRQVWVMGPGGERHYYAHLDDWRKGLETGDLVAPGDPLGTVGTTGNARGTPPHLHYGVYGKDGAYDPLPLLKAYPR